MKRIFRAACAFAGLLALAFGGAPVLFGVLNAGCLALLGFGALLFALAVLWDAFRLDAGNQIVRSFHTMWDRRPPAARPAAWWRRLRAAAALLLAAGFLIGAAVSVPMARQAYFTSPGEEPRTALVLGCQVEREGPSLMLARRLEAARRYLEAHPDAPVVVSGGYEERAGTSEAAVMVAWLIERGIDPARIRLEDRSHSTEENLAFSAEIIGREGLPRALAVATDGFHQYRAAIYARKNGLTAAALPAGTPWGLFPSYWVRDIFGNLKALILD